ncbi:hypothetical protein BDK51DRAFT_51533 [Blyttiomyces helicus]|uniref:Uncharacterized protein n=1 Tax=Blyttiomyces helicus TaxID=388810 RepID=A0A4P9WFF8_9FUNG|nr:hypothetical protein BDK51DRAFT_51533 [Blyttiomyces helicus]|eukprot:RKO91142.1 hypothetical protein BDK51DRAFT_51533 [Blyttiomyces helicus]
MTRFGNVEGQEDLLNFISLGEGLIAKASLVSERVLEPESVRGVAGVREEGGLLVVEVLLKDCPDDPRVALGQVLLLEKGDEVATTDTNGLRVLCGASRVLSLLPPAECSDLGQLSTGRGGSECRGQIEALADVAAGERDLSVHHPGDQVLALHSERGNVTFGGAGVAATVDFWVMLLDVSVCGEGKQRSTLAQLSGRRKVQLREPVKRTRVYGNQNSGAGGNVPGEMRNASPRERVSETNVEQSDRAWPLTHGSETLDIYGSMRKTWFGVSSLADAAAGALSQRYGQQAGEPVLERRRPSPIFVTPGRVARRPSTKALECPDAPARMEATHPSIVMRQGITDPERVATTSLVVTFSPSTCGGFGHWGVR